MAKGKKRYKKRSLRVRSKAALAAQASKRHKAGRGQGGARFDDESGVLSDDDFVRDLEDDAGSDDGCGKTFDDVSSVDSASPPSSPARHARIPRPSALDALRDNKFVRERKIRGPYTGDAPSTLRHHRKIHQDAVDVGAVQPGAMFRYLLQPPSQADQDRMMEEAEERKGHSIEECLSALEAEIAKATKAKSTTFRLAARLNCMESYFKRRQQGSLKMAAAQEVVAFMGKSTMCHPRTLLNHANYFQRHLHLLVSKQGCHQKTSSMFADEDIRRVCLDWLMTVKANERTPEAFHKVVNEALKEFDRTVSLRTAQRWMNTLGYKYGQWKKGVYVDGHERPDVVERRVVYSKEMMGLRRNMLRYERDPNSGHDDDLVEVRPSPPLIVKYVWVTHDESCYWANDAGGRGWFSADHPDMHKKTRGRAYMVSDFICACHGRLHTLDDDGNKQYVTEYIEVGKNHDGYWKAEDVVKQLRDKALPAFKALHPDLIGVWGFDNSTNHNAMPPDALNAHKMNKGAGSKAKNMTSFRDGWYMVGNERKTQSMMFTDADGKPQPRGVEAILRERALMPQKLRLKCDVKRPQAPLADDLDADGCGYTCCCRHRLNCQPDFLEQKSLLDQVLFEHQHLSVFFPKFHCELNPIEMLWGYSKGWVRRNCSYNFAGLKENVPISLERCPMDTVRRYFRRCWYLIGAYHRGISYKVAIYARKKYKSHRRVPPTFWKDVENELRDQAVA